jgi:hypothetical protein
MRTTLVHGISWMVCYLAAVAWMAKAVSFREPFDRHKSATGYGTLVQLLRDASMMASSRNKTSIIGRSGGDAITLATTSSANPTAGDIISVPEVDTFKDAKYDSVTLEENIGAVKRVTLDSDALDASSRRGLSVTKFIARDEGALDRLLDRIGLPTDLSPDGNNDDAHLFVSMLTSPAVVTFGTTIERLPVLALTIMSLFRGHVIPNHVYIYIATAPPSTDDFIPEYIQTYIAKVPLTIDCFIFPGLLYAVHSFCADQFSMRIYFNIESNRIESIMTRRRVVNGKKNRETYFPSICFLIFVCGCRVYRGWLHCYAAPGGALWAATSQSCRTCNNILPNRDHHVC